MKKSILTLSSIALLCLVLVLIFLKTPVSDQESASTGSQNGDFASSKQVSTTVGNDSEMEKDTLAESPVFRSLKIPNAVFARMKGISYPEGCTISRSKLRYVKVTYYGFDGEYHVGELVVNKAIAKDVVKIFRELYNIQYPIESIKLIDDYNGSDEDSMEANNTSCFNYRVVSGTDQLSNHAKGLAIDINPLYNPYVKTVDGKTVVEPVTAASYVDRSAAFPYKITKQDKCYKIFTKYGFTWGGSWKSCKDYQHFEKTP